MLRVSVGILTALIASLFLIASPTHAASPPDSCFAFDSGTGTITDYYDNEANNPGNPACTRDVEMPASIGGSAVTSIGDWAFYNNQLASVTIPNSVTSIGASAFSNNQLTSVTIPDSVTSIGNYAFSNNQLGSVDISSSMISIGQGLFQGNKLTSVEIPNTVIRIGNDAFASNQLGSVVIPSSVTTLENGAFYNNHLSSVIIQEGVTSIGDYAFTGNQIISVTIPNSVTSLGNFVFAIQNPWGRDLDWCENGAPCLWSSDPAEVQDAYDSIWYVKLYTEDPSNPNNLVNSILDEDYWWGDDANQDGVNSSLGGHLINPASLTLQYVNATNASLRSARTFTGKLSSGIYMQNYAVEEGPVVPAPVDSSNPTPVEQQAIDDALAVYFRLGQSVTIAPPAIDDYETPSVQTFLLSAANTTKVFTYTTRQTAPIDSIPKAPDSGVGRSTQIETGTVFLVVGVALLFASWYSVKRSCR